MATQPIYFGGFDTTLARTTYLFGDRTYTERDSLNFTQRHLLARLKNLALALTSPIPWAVDAAAGLAGGITSIGTLGLRRGAVNFAARELLAASDLLSAPFEFFVRTINPSAHFSQTARENETPDIDRVLNLLPINTYIRNPILTKARTFSTAQTFPKKHLLSRLSYTLLLLSSVTTRLALLTLALPAATLSIGSLGKCKKLNNFAKEALQAPGILSDIILCTIKIINPRAGSPRPNVNANDEQEFVDMSS